MVDGNYRIHAQLRERFFMDFLLPQMRDTERGKNRIEYRQLNSL